MKKNYKELYESVEYLFLNQKKITNEKQAKVYWLKAFTEYIKDKNINLYNEATKHTNKLESNNYFTEEELKKFKS